MFGDTGGLRTDCGFVSSERISAESFDALVGSDIWGCLDWREERELVHPPGVSLDDGAEVGEDGDMGKTAMLIVVATCACATPPKTEPFTPARRSADPDGMRRAYQAMVEQGLEPVIDPGAGAAYGATAPIITAWRQWNGQAVRWAVFYVNGDVVVDSVCREVVVPKYGASTKPGQPTIRRCEQQEAGLSATAEAIAAEVAAGTRTPDPAPSVAPPSPEPLEEFCFRIEDGAPNCFSTLERCEKMRADLGYEGIGKCERR
jgi:hypothetical protein